MTAAMLALAGCSSSEKKLQQQEARIRVLTSDNNMLVEQNRQVVGDRDIYRSKFETTQQLLDAHQQQMSQVQQLISAKDAQISDARKQAELANARAAQADAKADKFRDLAAKPTINVSTYGQGATGGAATGGPATAGASSGGQGKYHLRIISLPGDARHGQLVQEMAQFLRAQGVQDVNPRRSGQFWVIDIGNFSSIRSPEAVSVKNKVRDLKYRGIQQFKSAYFAEY
jgi:hypothetical protein